jgi:hypothetical protein
LVGADGETHHGVFDVSYLRSVPNMKILSPASFAELREMLMDTGGFISVGRAYIINLRNIKNIDTATVRLYHNISIPIPRGKYGEIKKAFWDFQCDRQED